MDAEDELRERIAQVLCESMETRIRTVIRCVREGEEIPEKLRRELEQVAEEISREDYIRIGAAKLDAVMEEAKTKKVNPAVDAVIELQKKSLQ